MEILEMNDVCLQSHLAPKCAAWMVKSPYSRISCSIPFCFFSSVFSCSHHEAHSAFSPFVSFHLLTAASELGLYW